MKFLREPLLHFAIAGGVLFAVYAGLARTTGDANQTAARTVHITANDIEWLSQAWAKQWQRAPTDQELKGLVTGYLQEELLAREAREIGLDENDTVVRRRLAQKMEFMVQDTVQLAEPGEEELRHVYDTHRKRFQSPARVSFTHIYFNRDQRGAQAEADAVASLRQLSQPDGWARAGELGDRFVAEYEFADVDEQTVSAMLGDAFAQRVFALETGPWQGPIESSYGLHLVRVTDKQAAQPREFDSARAEVLALWRQQREEITREQYFAALFKKYDVVVDESLKPFIAPLASAQEQGL